MDQANQPRSQVVRRILRVAMGCVTLGARVFLGVVGAAAGFLGAAFFVSSTAVISAAAVIICFAIVLGMSWLGTRGLARRHRRRIALGTGASVTAVLVLLSALTVFKPSKTLTESVAPPVPSGVHFFDLPTGSRIAYLRLNANPRIHDEAVIFVHGGPGAGIVRNEAVRRALEPLTDEGYDIYLYDQIGGGLSGRLANIEDYVVSRHVADLEAIREHIGCSKVILIGKSWGAQLITRYIAAHPENVARCVIVSPGPQYPREWKGDRAGRVTDRMSEREREAFNRLLTPRIITAMILARINPKAAVRFLPESEADAFGAAAFSSLIAGTVCDPAHVPEDFRGELSFWTAQMTGRDLKRLDGDLSAVVASAGVPALIIRGECDYANWWVTWEYKELFPESQLILAEKAGHMLFLEQPETFTAATRAFLLGQPMPFPVYTDSLPPQGD
jgi:pimeloyl-ACP methyl ester carboxylesterase